jgi:hypothetical protein
MVFASGVEMQSNRSYPPGVPGDTESTEITFQDERDIQQRMDSLYRTICDLLMANEMLRHQLAAKEASVDEKS